jgi:prolipoprotein diacylglyceryltransferase
VDIPEASDPAATLATVPTAVIAFDFDPLYRLGDGAVRWETIGIAIAIFAALVVAGAIARTDGLRLDDLLFVVLGIVPGAVVGGRLGYVLLYPGFFVADAGRIVDPGVGSLELTLAVVGGTLSGALVAALLDGQPGRWVRVAPLPTLLVLGVGKLAMVLGGSGQGRPTTGEPATAYLGPGPWGSLGPELPSIPSQALEGIAALLLLAAMLAVLRRPSMRRADGRAFLSALAAWCVVRLVVAGTWRDPVAVGPLRAEQAIDLIVLVAVVVVAVVAARRPAISRGQPEA